MCVAIISCRGTSQDASALGTTQSAGTLLSQANALLTEKAYSKAAAKALEAAELAPSSAGVQQSAAEIVFLAGEPEKSLPLFDRSVELSPRNAPYNWQRGIALCCCGKFEAGAEQFKTHHDVNPDDVENSAWYFLCVAKTQSIRKARESVIPSRGDGRQPMMSVLQMLQEKLSPADVIDAAVANTSAGQGRDMAKFYADLYVGLYYDSLGDNENAVKFLKRSLSYGTSGYMPRSSEIYLQSRFANSIVQSKSN